MRGYSLYESDKCMYGYSHDSTFLAYLHILHLASDPWPFVICQV
jgi:hypothetical protein